MTRILFVCHGNICRSPMAEFILKDLAQREGMSDRFEIASAATSREEIGNPVDPRARRELLGHGMDASKKRARQLAKEDYDRYDYLIGMDASNLRGMERICGGDLEGKMTLLLSYTGEAGEVADPWYSGDFDRAYRQIVVGCRALWERCRRDEVNDGK